MRAALKIILILGVIIALMSASVRASAAEGTEYIVEENGTEYVLSSCEGGISSEILRSAKFDDIAEHISGNSASGATIVFAGITSGRDITIRDGGYIITGSLRMSEGADFVIDGGNVVLSSFSIELSGGSVRVKDGTLRISESSILSYAESALVMEHASSAEVSIISGRVITESRKCAISLKRGTLKIQGGNIESTLGYGIDNSSTLKLSGAPEIRGREHDIKTNTPIYLKDTAEFSGILSVRYSAAFSEGGIACVFYSASEASISDINLYDINNTQCQIRFFDSHPAVGEKHFAAVYSPYKAEFYINGNLFERHDALSGDKLIMPSAPDKEGYDFSGWKEEESGSLYDFARDVTGNIKLNGEYKLSPPTFFISSMSFVYDKNEHGLALSDIKHPLLDSAVINCVWFRDGDKIPGSGTEIMLKSVSESGSYKCKLYFAVNNEISIVETPEVYVNIEKAEVPLPTATPKYYTGEYQSATLYSTALYSVENTGGSRVGIYPVKLTLTDSENYIFENGKDTAYCDFQILKADNFFTSPLEIKNIYSGTAPSPTAHSRFGEVSYLYSKESDGVYTEAPPVNVGNYYCKAYVSGTENYYEISSEPALFSIILETITGISVSAMPERTSYTAFEKFDASGLVLSVSYNSSRVQNIGSDEYTISYIEGGTLRFSDNYVIASYLGYSVSVPVSVAKADYDISGIVFADSAVTFDGTHKSVLFSGTLPIGIDGIPLEAFVSGGGINAGVYYVSLSFGTKSKNYNIPQKMTAKLTVLPYECSAVFESCDFIYDGALKCPTAYYVDIYGRKIMLDVSGERSLAGEYTATADCLDNNYKIINPSCEYKIAKADYNFDYISWSSGSFVYDGSEKSVILSGLPLGISVIGYSDSKATNAGVYNAVAVISYDENNYNPPPTLSYTWKIEKAEYDLSGFSFSDSYPVYNGDKHYPMLSGAMPMGIDGITLEYRYSAYAVNVNEGKVSIEIIFSTQSKNYKAPRSLYAAVQVTPMEISVVWNNLEFVYNGAEHMPIAAAAETDLMVLGSAINAGIHKATAISLDPNYKIINSVMDFTVNKAENYWTGSLKIDNVFEGGALMPNASCAAGEVLYYYTDEKGQRLTAVPSAPGKYYVVAESLGNDNYKAISSEGVLFEIIKITPVSISVLLNKNTFIAFETVSARDISAQFLNNNGSVTEIPFEMLTVIYQNGASMRFDDTHFTVSHSGFSVDVSVEVEKAEYDVSGVVWENCEFVYDGEEKRAELIGLPSGVSVDYYIGGVGVFAGEYPVSAVLSYDSFNYKLPVIEGAVLKIKKQKVTAPKLPELIYNGTSQAPRLSENGIYKTSVTEGCGAGLYPVEFTLSDSKNYEFENGEGSVRLYYEIRPISIKISVSDVDKYLFEKPGTPSYEIISGELIPGEELELSYSIENGRVVYTSKNPNYSVSFEGGIVKNHKKLSSDGRFKLFILLLILITLLLLTVILIKKRCEIKDYVAKLKCKAYAARVQAATSSKEAEVCEAYEAKPVTEEKSSEEEKIEIDLSVDAARADSLITDDLAKDLVRREGVKIYTSGNKRGIINVDTLSRNFESGETIDVNKLKKMSLIPYDTAYIKILARGMIDKPLRVYANDFSLAAVKMLALTGGEAIRVTTVKIKEKTENKKNNESY